VGETDITIALTNPQYVDQQSHYSVPPYSSLISNFADDFEELLTSKGLRIRGPFKSHDEMLYGDKMDTDFILEIGVGFNKVSGSGWTSHPHINILTSTPSYSFSLDLAVEGQLTLTAVSPVNKEKIWKKNVTTDAIHFSVDGTTRWTGTPTFAQILQKDQAVFNEVAKKLETYYN
jgi:hypothetical protein